MRTYLSLIISIQLIFVHPFFAFGEQERIKPVAAETSEAEEFTSDSDDLREAFASLKKAARDAGAAGSEDQVDLEPVEDEDKGLGEEITSTLDASADLVVDLELPEEDFAVVLKEFSGMSLQDLPQMSSTQFSETASIFLAGGIKNNTRELIGRILHKLLPELDLSKVRLKLSGLLVPRVDVRTKTPSQFQTGLNNQFKKKTQAKKDEPKEIYEIEISAGAIAFSETIDELAAQISSAVSEANPEVYGFQDDPKLYRELEEAGIYWDRFDKATKERIKQDLAAIEKVVDAGFRAESLFVFESRIYNQFLHRFKKKWRYFFTRRMVNKYDMNSFEDKLFKTRQQVQQAYLGYVQLSKDKHITQASFEAHHPFTGRDRGLHRRMKFYVKPFFSSLLHWGGPTAAIVLPPYIKLGWGAITAYFGINLGHLETVVEAEKVDEVFGKIVAEHEHPQWVVELVTPIVDLGKGAASIMGEIGSGIWYAGGQVVGAVGSVNDSLLYPYVWSPIGSFVGAVVGGIGYGASVGWNGLTGAIGAVAGGIASAYGAAKSAIGNSLDRVLPAHDEGRSAFDNGEIYASDGYDKLFDWSSEYVSEFFIGLSALALARHIYKHPQQYKAGTVMVLTGVKDKSVALARGIVNRTGRLGLFTAKAAKWTALGLKDLALLPYITFRDIRLDLQSGVELNEDLSNSDYIEMLKYLQKSTYQNNVDMNLPENIKRDIDKNFGWVARMLYIRVLDRWLLRVQKGKFTKEEIVETLSIMNSGSYPLFKKLIRKRRFVSRLMTAVTYLADQKNDEAKPWLEREISYDGLNQFHHNYYNLDDSTYNGTSLTQRAYVLSFAQKAAKEKDMKSLLHALHYYQRISRESAGLPPLSKLFYRILSSNLNAITEFVFSGEVTGKEGELYSKIYADIMNSSSKKLEPGQNGRLSIELASSRSGFFLKSLRMALATAKLAMKDRQHLIAEISRKSDLKEKKKFIPALSSRRIVEKLTRKTVRQRLRRMKSISEIATWVQSLADRNANLSAFSEVFYEEITSRPGLFKSKEDVALLFENDYFWLQLPMDNTNVSKLEEKLVEQLREKAKKHSEIWKFSPAQAEIMHKLIVDKLEELGAMPDTFEGKLDLWLKMTNKGVTSTTDKLFWSVMDSVTTKKETALLEKYALDEGRIWETNISSSLSLSKIRENRNYKKLLKHPGGVDRLDLLIKVLEFTKDKMPNRGMTYANFLEEISVEIRSTPQEALLIEKAKRDPGNLKKYADKIGSGDEEDEDSSYQLDENVVMMEAIFEELHTWRTGQVIDFVMYLRGAAPASKKVRRAFKTIGPERIKRIFETLPLGARHGALNTLFMQVLFSKEAAQQGLVDQATRKIMGDTKTRLGNAIIGKGKTPVKVNSRKVLEAFFYALEETGNGVMASMILSYLYALPPEAQESSGQTLKHVFEAMGTLFVKFGQKIAATKILPSEENVHLEDLRENANPPARGSIYYDLTDIFNLDSPEDLPFTLGDLLGAASVKYAVSTLDENGDPKTVIKVFRLDAIRKKDLQAKIATHMSDYLIKKWGSDFLIFKTLADASKQAVEDEIDAAEEVRKSTLSRKTIYANRSTEDVIVEVPVEDLVSERAIVSAYAEGISFDQLKNEYPAMAEKVAKVIFAIETDILFGQDGAEFNFEPDRHAGNYRLAYEKRPDGSIRVFVRPIDIGLLTKITPERREDIIRGFALAQILKNVGTNRDITETISNVFNLNEAARKKLAKNLRRTFPNKNFEESQAYIALLSAVSGAKGEELNRNYVDFITAILQLTQYDIEGLPEDQMSPQRYFRNQVSERVLEYGRLLDLSKSQELGIKWFNFKSRVKAFFGKGDGTIVPTDLDKLITDNVEIEKAYLKVKGDPDLSYGEVLQVEDLSKKPVHILRCEEILARAK